MINDDVVQREIRAFFGHEKPEGYEDVLKGEFTEADLEKVTWFERDEPGLTDASLKDVAKLQNLTHLVLQDNQITDDGLKEIAKLQKLDYLNLNGTKITQEKVPESTRFDAWCVRCVRKRTNKSPP